MEKYQRNTIFSEIKEYCYLSAEHDFIEISEWKNGDGFDVIISNRGTEERIPITWGQFKLLKKMVKKLDSK
jgi:hypothetical protein